MKIKLYLGFFYKLVFALNKFFKLKKNSVTIINYHGIEDSNINNFKSQITWLNDNYKIISPNDFFNFMQGNIQIEEHSVLITFDDGFISSYNVIQNVLNPLELKVIFFIPSMFINESKKNWKKVISNNFFSGKFTLDNFPKCFKPIFLKKINILIKQGHKVEGHTHSHCDISKINSKEQLIEEIINPIKIYKTKLNIILNSFAFPYGRINNINHYLLKKISQNYTYCFSNIRGSNTQKTSNFAIKRQNVSPDMPINFFGFIIEGGLDFYWKKDCKTLNTIANKLE